jgi:hypothetical protein
MYINPVTLSNQSTPAPGLLPLTAEQEAIYLQYNGFVRVISTDPVEIEPDIEAWESWKAEEAGKAQVVQPPTLEERLTALELLQLSQMGVTPSV